VKDRHEDSGSDVRHLNEMFLDLLVEAVERKDFASLRRMHVDSRIYTCLSSMAQQEKKWIKERLLERVGDTPLFQIELDNEFLSSAKELRNQSK